MMSRRNVISVCMVIAVIMVLVIILASTGIKKEKNNDGNSGSGGMYATGQSEHKDNKQEISDEFYKEAGQEAVINNEPEKMIPQKYIIKDIGDGIAIYKCFSDADKEVQKFFDYALINTDNLPHDKKELLKTGIELYGEDELYEFLQAYSS